MYLLFDIGGSKMRFAVSPDGKQIGKPIILSSPRNFDEALEKISQIARELSPNQPITKAAGGIAGIFNHDRTVLLNSPHNPNWSNQPVKEKMSKVLGCEVYLENDTAIVGLGEATTGPGIGHSIVAYITVSTGVGGARIVNGRIDPTSVGFEPGHQIIDIEGGQLEDYIAGATLEQKYGKHPDEIIDPHIWDEVAKYLAIGIHNTICYWSPDVVILGGGITKSINLDQVQIYLKQTFNIYTDLPEIEKSKLDDLGGIYGALSYLNQLIK